MDIKGFDGEYAFLSNFYERDIKQTIAFYDPKEIEVFNDKKSSILYPRCSITCYWPTAEHAFHAYKTLKDWTTPLISEIGEFVKFLEYETPGKAKRAGRKVPLNLEYWGSAKKKIMYLLLLDKFSRNHRELREKLKATGDAYLEETNTWNDTYWGVCNGVGENNLGKLLMKVRSEILEEDSFPAFECDEDKRWG